MPQKRPRRHLSLKGNTYWFRRAIPAAIRSHFGGNTAYLVSLGTGDIREAQRRRDQVEKECDRLFATARQGTSEAATQDTIRQLGEHWAEQIRAAREDALGWTESYLGRARGTVADEEAESPEAWAAEEAERIEAQHGEAQATRFLNYAHGRVPVGHYLEPYLKEADLAPKTRSERRGLVNRMATWAEKEALSLPDFNRGTASRYVTKIISPLHHRTAKKHLTALRGYWDYLKRRGHVREGTIWDDQLLPQRGRRAERSDQAKERPFTAEEMRKLLYSPYPNGLDRAWEQQMHDAMRISALSGMRLAEVITLWVSECDSREFRVGQGKTSAAVRPVPIHPDLKEVVERRLKDKKGSDWLFHELAGLRDPGDTFGKRFARYREKVGVVDEREGKRRSLVNFHSFRRWFVTEAERAGQPESTIAAVVGHSEGRRSVTFGVYSGGPSEAQLRACVEAVMLPLRQA